MKSAVIFEAFPEHLQKMAITNQTIEIEDCGSNYDVFSYQMEISFRKIILRFLMNRLPSSAKPVYLGTC